MLYCYCLLKLNSDELIYAFSSSSPPLHIDTIIIPFPNFHLIHLNQFTPTFILFFVRETKYFNFNGVLELVELWFVWSQLLSVFCSSCLFTRVQRRNTLRRY